MTGRETYVAIHRTVVIPFKLWRHSVPAVKWTNRVSKTASVLFFKFSEQAASIWIELLLRMNIQDRSCHGSHTLTSARHGSEGRRSRSVTAVLHMLLSFTATCFDRRIKTHHQADKPQEKSHVHHDHFTLSLYTVYISSYRIITTYGNMIR